MAKIKNKRNAERRNISQTTKKVLNPFEIHVNKEKLRILGRRTKNDRGMPGISRSKALKKRKHTLLQEYTVHKKSNKFIDKRIGERDNISEQDKSLVRYSAIRKKAHKTSIFNLADEVLTHRGQTLNEIENFENPQTDEEENSADENCSGKLDSAFVEEAHFGGGLLRSTGINGVKSHKDLIDQLIAESKKRKAEKRKLKEQTLELTERLDSEWKELLPLVSKTAKADETITNTNTTNEYDKTVQELKFEARGTPSDRLKSEDEIAKEERKKLEKLEHERLERMKGFVEEKASSKNHRSGDDLQDNFAYESESEAVLSYNAKGEANLKVEAEFLVRETDENESKSAESSSDEESRSESNEDNLSDLKEVSESEEEEEERSDDVSTDKITDQTNNEEHSDSNKMTEETLSHKNVMSCKTRIAQNSTTEQEQIRTDLLKRKEIINEAKKDLPFTFDLPEDYDTLLRLLKDKNPMEHGIILERIIKCNHPSLAENNKKHLGMLFVYLLQYINDLSSDGSDMSIRKCFQIFSSIVPYMFDLLQFDKENSQHAMLEVIKEKQTDFRSNPHKYPDIDVLLFLKLVSCLFSTSDFRHQVVTPSLVYIDQMLNNCRVRNKRDIAYGIFLVTLISEYTYFSKRYLPSAINFLVGVLRMTVPKIDVKVVPPFKSTGNDLVLKENLNENVVHLQLDIGNLSETEISNEFKIQSFYIVLNLLANFLNQFHELPSNYEIFTNTLKYLNMIEVNNYPDIVQKQCSLVKDQIQALCINRHLEYIVPEKKRPKALRLYEPNIQKVFDGKRHKIQSKEKMERAKLLQKLKKERKGALREIRRDGAFLGRVKLSQQIQSDMERKNKVKRLFAEAAVQQSELNAMKRKKK